MTTAVRADSNLIVPGHCAGQLRIGQDAITLEKTLGKCDYEDAAMGHDWLTWYTKSRFKWKANVYQLDILKERDDASGGSHSYVQQVWFTSPWFHTRNGIAVGAHLTRIRRAFPAIHPLLRNSLEQPPKDLYDDVKKGIGFEVQGGKCIAIIIHSPGTAAPRHYYSHYNNDRWLPVKH